MEPPGEFGVRTEAVAVAPNVDDVTVLHEAVHEARGHDVVAEALAPLLEALVARADRRGVLVAPGDDLEEEHRPDARDREVADLVDHHETEEDERLEPLRQAYRGLGILQRVEEICERRKVDPTSLLGGPHGERQREVRPAHTGRPEELDVLLAVEEAARVQALELLALDRRLEREVEVGERREDGEARGPHRSLEPPGVAQVDVGAKGLRAEMLTHRGGRGGQTGGAHETPTRPNAA